MVTSLSQWHDHIGRFYIQFDQSIIFIGHLRQILTYICWLQSFFRRQEISCFAGSVDLYTKDKQFLWYTQKFKQKTFNFQIHSYYITSFCFKKPTKKKKKSYQVRQRNNYYFCLQRGLLVKIKKEIKMKQNKTHRFIIYYWNHEVLKRVHNYYLTLKRFHSLL